MMTITQSANRPSASSASTVAFVKIERSASLAGWPLA